MFFTTTHATHDVTKQKEVFNHLCEMMRNILKKNGRKITYQDEKNIQDTANADLRHIITNDGLETYYNRMKAGTV